MQCVLTLLTLDTPFMNVKYNTPYRIGLKKYIFLLLLKKYKERKQNFSEGISGTMSMYVCEEKARKKGWKRWGEKEEESKWRGKEGDNWWKWIAVVQLLITVNQGHDFSTCFFRIAHTHTHAHKRTHTRTLAACFLHSHDIQPNLIYKYQFKYILDNRVQCYTDILLNVHVNNKISGNEMKVKLMHFLKALHVFKKKSLYVILYDP